MKFTHLITPPLSKDCALAAVPSFGQLAFCCWLAEIVSSQQIMPTYWEEGALCDFSSQ